MATDATPDAALLDDELMLDAEDRAWRDRARQFARETVAPVARGLDRARTFSRDLVRQLGAAGLIGAGLPKPHGGGASHLARCLIAEELGAIDGSIRGFHAVQSGLVLAPLLRYGDDAQQARWLAPLIAGEAIGAFALTESEAGSDVGAIGTTVKIEGDDAVIDGEKIWITNGGVADVILVFAQAAPDKRTKGLACWLVPADTPGLTREPVDGEELGHRSSDHARLTFENVRVPLANRLGPEHGGFGVAMHGLASGRLNVAAGAVGALRACLEASIAHAQTRRQFGKRIGDFQQVGATLAEMSVDLRAARLLVHDAARQRSQGTSADEAVSAAKLFATEAALRGATQALQLHGNRGYTDALPIERHYRDLVALTIYEGTSNIQKVILARALLGRDEEARRD